MNYLAEAKKYAKMNKTVDQKYAEVCALIALAERLDLIIAKLGAKPAAPKPVAKPKAATTRARKRASQPNK